MTPSPCRSRTSLMKPRLCPRNAPGVLQRGPPRQRIAAVHFIVEDQPLEESTSHSRHYYSPAYATTYKATSKTFSAGGKFQEALIDLVEGEQGVQRVFVRLGSSGRAASTVRLGRGLHPRRTGHGAGTAFRRLFAGNGGGGEVFLRP